MTGKEQFISDTSAGYRFKGDAIILGIPVFGTDVIKEVQVKAPLKTFNRHGLIAGATGTGKTKTLQHIAECLSSKGVSCLLMYIKGDLSGLAKPGISQFKN